MTPRSPKLTRTGLTLSTFVLFAGSLFSQTTTTGDLTGAVKDSSGGVIPGAHVLLKSVDNGDTRTDTANDNGSYRFTTLKPGNYSVTAEAGSLRSSDVRLSIGVGEVAKVDITVKIPTAQTIIEVNEAATPVNADNANATATISSKQIASLPIPGGDLTTVAFTVPGIALSTGAGYGNFSSHGLPGTANLYTMNGNDYNDPYLNLNNSGASNLLLGQTEVAEASVTQNGYSVQYGRQAGAQVNYVTKSGGNAIHADLLFNFNNHLMNANDFFANRDGNARPYAVSKQWGADIGGAIIKNKLFFFSDSEGIYYTLPSTGVVVFPSQQFEQYTLSTITPAQVPLYTKAFSIYKNAPGSAGAQTVTNGNGPLQDNTGNMGCGSVFSGTPAPNGGTFGTDVSCAMAYATSGSNTNKEWLETHRVDWNINDAQKIFFRFKGDHGFQPTSTSLLSPTLNEQSIQPQYEGQINHTYVISPTTVNNFVGSVLWYSAFFGPASTSAASNLFPTFFGAYPFGGAGTIGYGDSSGATGAGSSGFTAIGNNWTQFPQGRNVGQLQLIDDFSSVKSNHTLKFGVNFRRNRVTDSSLQTETTGSYSFANIADFAAGVTNGNDFSDYLQKFSTLASAHIRFYNIGIYAQDEWAVKPNIKLTYGIRLDRTGNPLCTDKCYSNFTAPFDSSSFQQGVNIPYDKSILVNQSHAYYNVTPIVADPRFSLVWSPSKLNGTVLRGGFGVFSDLAPGGLVSNIFNNGPFPFTTEVADGSAVNTANDPASAAAEAAAQYNALKTGFFGGQTLAQLQNVLPTFSPFSYFSIPQTFKTPTYLEWSFELQQPIGAKNVVALTYSGNHGYNLIVQNGFANASATGFAGLPSVSPDPRFSAVTQLSNQGVSNYDGLTIQYRRSLGYGFQGQISYTWSHALDNMSNGGANEPYSFCSGCSFGFLPNPKLALDYGNADYDIRYNVTGDFIWDLPFKLGGNKLVSNLFGNWTLADKLYLRSGTPFSIIDSSLAGSLSPTINATMIATLLSGSLPSTCGAGSVNNACFNVNQFAASGAETALGNLGRNLIHGPSFISTDVSLYKNFNLTEKMRLQIGASAYNMLNHPNFQNPVADVAAGSFGTIQSTAIPPTSAYGAFQGSAVSGRVLVVTGKFNF